MAVDVAGPGGTALPHGLGDYLRSSAPTGRPLDGATRGELEASFGRPLDHVRVIHDGGAARAASTLQARAFTLGNAIWFGHGEYRPHTPEGRHLLAHEVAHSLQDLGGGGLIHADLVVGRSDDPAEREADRAADAVVRGQRASLSSSPAGTIRTLRMQRVGCSAAPGPRPDQRLIRCPSGNYLVTLTTTTERPRSDGTQTWSDVGYDGNEVWLTLGLCRGETALTVTPSLNLPEAAARVLGNVLAGSGALSDVNLTAGLQIRIIQSQRFTLTLSPTVTVDQRGVSQGGGTITVQTADVSVSVGGTYDPRSQSGSLTFTFSGGATQPTVSCQSQGRQRLALTCQRITHTAGTPEVPEISVPEVVDRYLFFNYARDTVRADFRRPPTRRGQTPSVDLRDRIIQPTDIQALHDQGYRITTIEGFTSPEGPRGPGPNFEGNIELANKRAIAARDWVQAQCPTCDLTGVTPRGRSELPLEQGQIEPEPRGRPMERGAVEGFLGSDPLRPTDAAVVAEFRGQSQTRQRDQVFELQRRALIRFERRRIVQQHRDAVPARDDPGPAQQCPPEVLDEARRSFGFTLAQRMLSLPSPARR